MKEFYAGGSRHCMRYHDLPGGGMPILFIHGLGCAGSLDYPQVAAQRELAGHRRLLVDLLGNGFSDKPVGFDYGIPTHVDCLLDFVVGLKLERFILFGHSLGGAIALALADRCRDRIESLVLAESNLDAGGGARSRRVAAGDRDEFVRRGFGEVAAEAVASGDRMWIAGYSVCSPEAVYDESKSLVEGQTPSWREILYSLDCPRTYIFGEKTLPSPDETELPAHGVRVEVVKNAGHFMAWENPEGLAAAIRKGIDAGRERG